MRWVVVTGMSGAGKTQALKFLEDLGYYCVDNLPPALLGTFISLLEESSAAYTRVAMGIDIRSGVLFGDMLRALGRIGSTYELLFLDCSDEILIGRFKETRRAHPLGEEDGVLPSVRRERELLQPLRESATHILDTTGFSLRALREALGEIFGADGPPPPMAITVLSFGFKYGLPIDADWVFDARFLPNPYRVKPLRDLSGLSTQVQEYIFSFPAAHEFLERILSFMGFVLPLAAREGRRHLVIAIGCTGGRHRSVALAQRVSVALAAEGYENRLHHRDSGLYAASEAGKPG